MPKHWYNRQAAIKKDEEDGTDINQRICADRKPRFMNYRYPTQAAEYNKYIKAAKSNARRKFGRELQDIIDKPRNAEEQNFVNWYYRMMPVGIGACTMNRVCSHVESALAAERDRWKEKSADFDYTIYKRGLTYDKVLFNKICAEVDACAKMVARSCGVDKTDMTSMDTAIHKELLYADLRKECHVLCRDSALMCDIILDATYGRGKSQHVAWSVCGEDIVNNLLARSGNKYHYVCRDDDGDIEYRGERYKLVEGEVFDEYYFE